MVAACNEIDGKCATSPLPDGALCDDGNPCTEADGSLAGVRDGAPVPGCGEDVDCEKPGPGICASLKDTADTWLEGGSNHGTQPMLIVGKHGGGFKKKRSLLRIATSDLPPGATVLWARLWIYYNCAHVAGSAPEQPIERVVALEGR